MEGQSEANQATRTQVVIVFKAAVRAVFRVQGYRRQTQ